MCSRLTPKLVGDQLPGCLSLMFQHLTKEALSGSTISTLGDHNIDHVSILIDGSPQIEVLTLDGDEEFIDVPDVAEPPLLPPHGLEDQGMGWRKQVEVVLAQAKTQCRRSN